MKQITIEAILVKQLRYILFSLGIGALLNYIICNLFGLVGADSEELISVLSAFIICMLVYVLFYLNDMKKTLTQENQQLREKVENLRKKVDADARQSATSEEVNDIYVKICELQEQLNKNREE